MAIIEESSPKLVVFLWLSKRGMVPSLERIAITPGAHSTMSTMTRQGDVILCEAITYPGLRAFAARMGLQLVGLPMDGAGILPDKLDAAIHLHQPKALYLNPTVQNPTIITISQVRRMEIAEVLIHHRLPLIEDDAYGFIPTSAPAPFASLVPNLTWHIGGLAKCLGAADRWERLYRQSGDRDLTPEPMRWALSGKGFLSVSPGVWWKALSSSLLGPGRLVRRSPQAPPACSV